MSPTAFRVAFAAALSILAAGLLGTTVHAAGERAPRDLSRWTGPWNLGDLPRRGIPVSAGNLRPELARRFLAAVTNETDADPRRWCHPADFSGNNGGVMDNVELLPGPGRLTLVSEGGLIRRIYTDGRSIPAALPDTPTGLSVGRWEGETLIVETTRLSPGVRYNLMAGDAVTLGAGAKIVERFRLADDRHLVIDTTLTAPAILTAPEQRRATFERAPPDYVPRQLDTCWTEDRSIDPASGRQRFDMTPPLDLPPPPPAAR